MKTKLKEISMKDELTEFLLYTSPSGEIKVEVFLQDETIWLTQKRIAELFGKGRSTITEHLQNIFKDGELQEELVSRDFRHTTQHGAIDGKTQVNSVKFYNLDAVLSVGYRVNSSQATQFRIWATKILEGYIIKGFAMNVERLKDPTPIFGKDYFREQVEIIRDIRSSERRMYQQITDIYAECSVDYDKNSEITKEFFATVQNKLHWAIIKQTAAEIIVNRADSTKEKMGLTTWKNSPKGKIRKRDVSVAKNYLTEKELKPLNRIVVMYLDYAEHQAQKSIAMTMKDWIKKLDIFLQFNEEEILKNSGKITAEIAKIFAENEFEKYKVIQNKDYISDFDKEVEKLKIHK
ncbi:MAG: virulence RhuM family protein [Candidatus Moranbacteria bacterium]|nr:virulence RhuM family protein [Candidatus Moranbacteria bacterium]